MKPTESAEYFTHDEDTESAKNGKRGRTRKRHTHNHKAHSPVGNIYITPANSSTGYKYKTPLSSKTETLRVTRRSPSRGKHHHRSRSLSIHIRPLSCSTTRPEQKHESAQAYCALDERPPYNPPSKSCSSYSTNSKCYDPPTPCNQGSNYHVYQPLASETESEQFCPDQIFKDLCEGSQYGCNENGNHIACDFNETDAGVGCSQNKRGKSSGCFEGDIRFNCVGNLPPPAEVWKLGRHDVNGATNADKGQSLFPFRKTPSGNFKICKDMVAFESNQVAVLVDDPKRTRINFKQSRHWCRPPSPPPIPPVPNVDSRGSSPDCSRHRKDDGCPSKSQTPRRSKGSRQQDRACSSSYANRREKKDATPCDTLPAPYHNAAVAKELCDDSTDWESMASRQCRTYQDFQDGFHYRLRRAIHPDMKVMVGEREFPCHSIALHAYSHYFDNLKRPRETIHCVKLPDDILEPDDFPSVMDWVLLDDKSKPRVISCDNVMNLYCAAKFLGMPGLKDHCICFINEKIKAGDPIILQMYEKARTKSRCKDLLSSLIKKLVELFPIMYKTKQFLNLGVQELITLLESDDIKIQSEVQVYDTALRWLLYDWKKRCDDTERVMRCVRFGLLSPLQLTQIQHFTNAASKPDQCRIFSIPTVKKMLQDGLTCAILRENYKSRPSELHRWIEMSHVKPPRPRCNCSDDGDIFRSASTFNTLQPSASPEPEHPNSPVREEPHCNSCTYDQNSCTPKVSNSDTVVRDFDSQDNENNSTCNTCITSRTYRPPSPEPQQGCKTPQNDPMPSCSTPRSPSPKQPKKKSNLGACNERSDVWNEGRANPHEYGDRYDDEPKDGSKHEGKLDYGSETFQVSMEPDLTPSRTGNSNGMARQPQAAVSRFRNHAAELIQAHYQGYVVRRKFLAMKSAAIKIQRFYRAHRHGKTTEARPERTRTLSIPDREAVVVFGGMNPKTEYNRTNNDCQTIYRYNPDENLWAEMGKLPEPRSHCGAVLLRNHIYIFGGSDPTKHNNQGKSLPSPKCWRLNPQNGKWQEMASMKVARTNFAYCHFHGKVYVFGGKNASGDVLSLCECFDPSVKPKGIWNFIMPMPIACTSMAATKHGEKIYVIGGVTSANNDGIKQPILPSVFIYEPKNNVWREGPPLRHGRCYSSAQSQYNHLYVVGGAGKETETDGTRSLDDVLLYKGGQWGKVGILKRPRHGHCMAKIGKYFLILGGVSSDTMEPLDTVELYNTETNRSSSRVANIPHKLTGMTAVVL